MGKEKNDWTLKVFALIIAIVLWSYVMSEVNPVMTEEFRNVKVNILNEASLEREGIVILEPENIDNIDIKVTISGRRSDIIRVSAEDIIVQVDLSGYGTGEVKVPIYVQVPVGVTLKDYAPKEILFKFDRIVGRERPVTVETIGELPEGYVLGTPTVKPQSVVVEGPSTWLKSLSKVVATVDVSNITDEDINVTVPVKLVDDEGNDVRGISTKQNSVDVTIPVFRVKRVPIEMETVNQLPDGYEIVDLKLNPSYIDIVGKKEVLDRVESISTLPIDIRELMKNKSMPVELVIPEGVSLLKPDQEVTATLNVEEIVKRTFELTLKDVEVLNLAPDLSINEEDLNSPFSLTIQGYGSIVESLKKEDIKIQMNLAGLREGSHFVTIKVQEENFTVISLSPERFEIRLRKY
jgi:YbbR domain-containing protein